MKKKYAKGTDSVAAVLTPREAVLNRNAAELLGRDAIKRLNDHGNMLAKRGVDLASLPSDPTPGPSTENMLGYQMGSSDVHDDRADLLRETENTFYGGGQAPMPTPTPTPKPNGYQYGSEDVRRRNAASRARFTGILEPLPSGSYYNPAKYANQGFSRGELNRIQQNLAKAYQQDLQYNRVANPRYQPEQDTGTTSTAQFGSGRATPATVQQYALRYGRSAGNGLSTFQTPSGGSITYRPSGRILSGGAAPTVGPSSDLGQTAAFQRPNPQEAYNMGYSGVPPTGTSPYAQSFNLGYQGGAVQRPEPSGIGYQIGSAIGNFSPTNFGQGLVNAASRIGQGIANVFTGGNAQAAPAATPNPAPPPTPIPQQTPVPTPTIPPDQNPYGFQYGTSSVPRRYSDYY